MAPRKERIASNQALYRTANERMRRWLGRQRPEPAEGARYFCECADNGCRQLLTLTADEYEAVRADARRFVIAPGHVYPEAERVAEDRGDYAVVEKSEELAPIVEALNPRRT